MKKKIIISSILVAFIGITCSLMVLKLSSTNVNNNKDINVNFSEVSYSEDSLISKADIILSGKIQKKVKTKTEIMKQNDPNIADINWTYSIYNLKVNEIISGDYSSEAINIVFAGSDLPEDIQLNKDYVFFLEKDSLGENKYHLVSYAQGVFDIKDDNNFSNKKVNMNFEKSNLKEKAKKLQAK